MPATQVKDLMESKSVMISPDATLVEAARMMKQEDCGFLPVGSAERPEGIITDRDIVIRAISEGKDPTSTFVRDCMTSDVCSCLEKDSLEEAARIMNENNVSRLVVATEDGNICGILTFGRIIRSNDNEKETSKVVQCATGNAT